MALLDPAPAGVESNGSQADQDHVEQFSSPRRSRGVPGGSGLEAREAVYGDDLPGPPVLIAVGQPAHECLLGAALGHVQQLGQDGSNRCRTTKTEIVQMGEGGQVRTREGNIGTSSRPDGLCEALVFGGLAPYARATVAPTPCYTSLQRVARPLRALDRQRELGRSASK